MTETEATFEMLPGDKLPIPPMGPAPADLRYVVELRPPLAGERYLYEPNIDDEEPCIFIVEASHDHPLPRMVVTEVQEHGPSRPRRHVEGLGQHISRALAQALETTTNGDPS